MKIAITALENNFDESKVDSRFGRAAGFFILDTETDHCKWLENSQNIYAEHGAGIQAAQTVINSGAEILVTGHVGPKAYKALTAGKIKIYSDAEKYQVNEIKQLLKENKLNLAERENTVGLG
ncbi:MAG: dinitrogenase iron-molybdenum cofactor biosynthesis protein [Candidatus Cloacimonadota bacterium]|nr:MAG: dinitrogenase iron-molybdenum cofactor biosynthesis protein [Candidatus Cloacimonadota bacterium]